MSNRDAYSLVMWGIQAVTLQICGFAKWHIVHSQSLSSLTLKSITMRLFLMTVLHECVFFSCVFFHFHFCSRAFSISSVCAGTDDKHWHITSADSVLGNVRLWDNFIFSLLLLSQVCHRRPTEGGVSSPSHYLRLWLRSRLAGFATHSNTTVGKRTSS